MKTPLYLALASLLWLHVVSAGAQVLQNQKAADSVLVELRKNPIDSCRFNTLETLFFANRNKPFALAFAEQMIRDARKSKNPSHYYSGVYNKELFFYTKQNPDSVAHYFKIIHDRLLPQHTPLSNRFLFNAWLTYIEVCVSQDNPEQGNIEARRMLREAKARNYSKGMAFAYNVLGEIATRNDSMDQAARYYHQALSTHALELQEEAVVFVHLAEQQFVQEAYDKSADYYIKAIQNYYKMLGGGAVPPDFYDIMLYNDIFVSYCFLMQNKRAECEAWMRKADSFYRPEAMIGAYMFYHIFKGLYYAHQNNYAQCMKHFAQAELRPENTVVVYSILEQKIKALLLMKRYEEAVPLQRQFVFMQYKRRSIIDRNNEQALSQNVKYLEAERENISLKHTLKIVFGAVVCIFLVAIVGILIRIVIINRMLSRRVRRLNEAKEEARKTDKMKELFLHNISHDVRIPLTSIIGFSQQLCDDAGMGEEERKMVRDILKDNSEKLMNLVNNVLDISRLESGKMKYAITDFDLVETCRLAELSVQNAEHPTCSLHFTCMCTDVILLKHDQQRMLKCLCAALTIPSYVRLTPDGELWEENMILRTFMEADGRRKWMLIIENSPLCSEKWESEEQSILNRINTLYMQVIGATYEIAMHNGVKSVIMRGYW